MCNKTNWKLKCRRALRPSMINLWSMLKMLIEVKSVGAESNTSVDKTQCSAQEFLDKWWYCYHVWDTMSWWTQHVPLCFILHTPVPETFALLIGELLYAVCDVPVPTQSAHSTQIWCAEAACVVISRWNTHRHVFCWFYHLNSIPYIWTLPASTEVFTEHPDKGLLRSKHVEGDIKLRSDLQHWCTELVMMIMYFTLCWLVQNRRCRISAVYGHVFVIGMRNSLFNEAVSKGKGHPITDHEGIRGGGGDYNSTFSLVSAQDKGVWLTPRHGRFTPGKDIGNLQEVVSNVAGVLVDSKLERQWQLAAVACLEILPRMFVGA